VQDTTPENAQALEFKKLNNPIEILPGVFLPGFATFGNIDETSPDHAYENGLPIKFWFTFDGDPEAGLPSIGAPIDAKIVFGFATDRGATNSGGTITQRLTYGTIQIATRDYNFDLNPGGADILLVDATAGVDANLTGGAITGPAGGDATFVVTGALGSQTYFTSDLPGFTDIQGGTISVTLPNASTGLTMSTFFIADFRSADDGFINFTPTPVPEPSSLILLGLTAAGGSFYGWRRRRTVAA